MRHAGVDTHFRRPKGAAGRARNVFLHPEQFERLAEAAASEDMEFCALLVLLCYTGLRLSEALRIGCEDLQLNESSAFCGKTKNGDPRQVHLPPRVVVALANHPRGLSRSGRLFRWSKCGELYLLASRFYFMAGVDDEDEPFHILRHTYGAWMTRVGADLVSTGVWRSETAARGYKPRKADGLPGAGGRAPHVRKGET
jgi:integrase